MTPDREETIDVLLAGCRDEDAVVREEAAARLGEVGHERIDQAGPALVALLADSDDSVRHEAALALGVLGYRPALVALMDTLRHDEDWIVRAGVAEALGDMRAPEALDVLQEAMCSDEAAPVRGYAALALGLVGDRTRLAAVREQLDVEGAPGVKAELAAAALRLGDDAAFDILLALGDTATRDSMPGWLEVVQDLLARMTPSVMLARGDEAIARLTDLGQRWSTVEPQAKALRQRLAERVHEPGPV